MTTPKNILVIDNDLVITKLIDSFLTNKGHNVKIAHDAFAALDILKTYTPDIIFIDLIMPKISGDKLCQMIRAMPQFAKSHIIIISATLAEETLDLKEIGANAAIIKGPFKVMSEYIVETIAESESPSVPEPYIRGLGDLAPRHITQELLSQNKYLQKLLESISQGVLEIENNRVLYANDSATAILRVDKEILLGAYLNEMLEIGLWKILGPRISTCTDISLNEDENNPVEIYDKHLIIQCLTLDENKNRRVVLLTDITSRKQMEAIVEATNLTKNLGYIFSGIRHEIGNPVNSIKMALTVLEKNLDTYDKDTVAEFVSRSLEEVTRLEYLLKALKNYSLFETPFVDNVAIDEFMENFIPLIREDLEKKGIEIRTNIPKEDIIALTDVRALHHVMLNLLTNAADAVTDADKPSITIAAEKDANTVRIKVDDNGCGIDEDDLKKIFTPFFTSKPQGTGLGLAIVQKMLMSMNSTITIQSIRDFGTTAIITLPEAE